MRKFVIGDVHGCAKTLKTLIEKRLELKKPDKLFLLGDYVDRGPDSKGVLDYLMQLQEAGFQVHCLKGNHEDMMLRFLAGPADENWLFNGGDATLVSYGVSLTAAGFGPHWLEDLRLRLVETIPDEHRRFLETLDSSYTVGDYLFVHAGIRPGVPLDAQRPVDLIWIRDRFLDSREDFGKCVVHGHTISNQPEVRANRIGIDTGAFYTNRLTCLVLEDEDTRFLHT